MPLNDFVFLVGAGALPDPVTEQNQKALDSVVTLDESAHGFEEEYDRE